MTVIIAEAGVNHNGSEELARQLIFAAKEAGADIVKFQTFRSSQIATSSAHQAAYQAQNTGKTENQVDMLKRLELDFDVYHRLSQLCDEIGIEFLSTAFDDSSLDFLFEKLNLRKLKIPSGEITNAPFLLRHALTGCDLILSTGMATLGDIENALGVLAFGLIKETAAPGEAAFQASYSCQPGQAALREKVTLLHCTTEYPTPPKDINLRAMDTMRVAYGLPVGYSDHSEGIVVSIAAVARGACLIEKHFTLDKTMNGPDHKASITPDELKQMVDSIRTIEQSLGDGIKGPQVSEVKNKSVARKSLIAARPINKGENFSADSIAIKRPGSGMSPFRYWSLLNRTARQDYHSGEILDE